MRFRESDGSPKQGGFELLYGNLLAPGSSPCMQVVKVHARLLFLSCLIVCFLPLSSAAQSSRETEAQNDIQAAKQAQQKGDYAQAVDGYRAALKLMPETPELYSNLGIAYYYKKEYERAIEAFRQALKRKPNLEGPNLFLGMAYIRTGQYEESIKPLRKAISLNPKLSLAYINLGASYNEVGKAEEALEVLQRAEKIFPNDEEVLYSLGSLHYDLMFKTYGKMAQVAPNSYRYHQVMGQSFEERQEYPGAIVEFKLALEKNPQAPGLHYALGNAYWLQGHNDEAKSEFEAELQIAPEDYLSTWKLGNIYLQERQFDKALTYLQKAIQEKPGLGQAYQDLGKLYLRTNDDKRALFYLQKVVQMAPTEANPHYLLALAYRHLGNTAESHTEMDLFEKLSKAQIERRRPPNAMLAGHGDETEEIHSSDAPVAH